MNIETLVKMKANPKVANVSPGDTVKVRVKVVEAGKERVQTFQGVVIKLKNGGAGASFTIRRMSSGIGVESTFPVYSPMLQSAEIMRHGDVRRAKLYYLRGRSGKESRIKERRVAAGELVVPATGEAAEPTPENVIPESVPAETKPAE